MTDAHGGGPAGNAPASDGAREWWREAFTGDYLDVYAHRDDTAAAEEVAGLAPRLRDAPGPVIDACCGNGRHLAALRGLGLVAVGFDLSADLLAVAARRPDCRGRVARGDVRRPPFTDGVGGVLLLFTAFGYFPEDGNARCLAALARLIAPGGWLVLDLPEPERLRAGLVGSSRRTTPGGLQIGEERRLVGARLEKEVTIHRRDGLARRYTESIRLYGHEEIPPLAEACGLAVVDTWPSLRGAQRDDGRMVWWLRRTT